MKHRVLLLIVALATGGVLATSAGVAMAAGSAPLAPPSAGPGATAVHASASPATTPASAAASAAAGCAAAVGPDGFGRITVTGNVVWAGDVTFTVPCIVQLSDGAALHVAHVRLKSDKLYFTELQPTGPRSSVEVLDSTLTGGPTGGLQIRMAHPGSAVTIANSSLSYVLSIGASVGAVDDGAASLNVLNSQFTSDDPSSEGVVLVSTGRGVFTNDRFAVNADQGTALIYAQRCVQANNVGSNKQCTDG